MSTHGKPPDFQKLEKAGKFLAERLNQARKRKGVLRCPVCQQTFDGTHLIKCPGCQTLISKSFQNVQLSGNQPLQQGHSSPSEMLQNVPAPDQSAPQKGQSFHKKTFQKIRPAPKKKLQKVRPVRQQQKLQLDFFA